MCVCESLHLCLWFFTFVFENLYICVCESLSLQEPSPYFNFIGAALSSMNGDAAKTRQNNFLAIATSTPLHNLSHSHLQGCPLTEDLVQMISSSCHHRPHQVSSARERRTNFKSPYNVWRTSLSSSSLLSSSSSSSESRKNKLEVPHHDLGAHSAPTTTSGGNLSVWKMLKF